MNNTAKYIGTVNMNNLRNFILDNEIVEGDTILIHPETFDELALDYRKTINDSLQNPLIFLGVTIRIDELKKTPKDRIIVTKEVITENLRIIDLPTNSPKEETIYRCGWCGNIVDENGHVFTNDIRAQKIRLYETSICNEIAVNGDCCESKWNEN